MAETDWETGGVLCTGISARVGVEPGSTRVLEALGRIGRKQWPARARDAARVVNANANGIVEMDVREARAGIESPTISRRHRKRKI